jgi:hypothetical protein
VGGPKEIADRPWGRARPFGDLGEMRPNLFRRRVRRRADFRCERLAFANVGRFVRPCRSANAGWSDDRYDCRQNKSAGSRMTAKIDHRTASGARFVRGWNSAAHRTLRFIRTVSPPCFLGLARPARPGEQCQSIEREIERRLAQTRSAAEPGPAANLRTPPSWPTYAFNRRPLSRASRPFIGPILNDSSRSVADRRASADSCGLRPVGAPAAARLFLD